MVLPLVVRIAGDGGKGRRVGRVRDQRPGIRVLEHGLRSCSVLAWNLARSADELARTVENPQAPRHDDPRSNQRLTADPPNVER